MSPVTEAIPFFSESELACRGTGVIKLDPRFATKLPELRRAWDRPLIVNSVCRSPEHNAAVGGHPRSLHLTENPDRGTLGTMAADVAWRAWDGTSRLTFARLAYSMGWSVGLHDGFCHIDRRTEVGLPQKVFVYSAWSGEFTPQHVVGA